MAVLFKGFINLYTFNIKTYKHECIENYNDGTFVCTVLNKQKICERKTAKMCKIG